MNVYLYFNDNHIFVYICIHAQTNKSLFSYNLKHYVEN